MRKKWKKLEKKKLCTEKLYERKVICKETLM